MGRGYGLLKTTDREYVKIWCRRRPYANNTTTTADPLRKFRERQEIDSKTPDNEVLTRHHSRSKQNIDGTSYPSISSPTSLPPAYFQQFFNLQNSHLSHGLVKVDRPPPPRPIVSGNFAAPAYLPNARSFSIFHLVDADETVSNSGTADITWFNGTGSSDVREQVRVHESKIEVTF